jgi:KaiC/GvpD/RAD55 family RecA-like ATPase
MLKLTEEEAKKIYFLTDEKKRPDALIAEEVDIEDFANKVLEYVAEKYGIEFM